MPVGESNILNRPQDNQKSKRTTVASVLTATESLPVIVATCVGENTMLLRDNGTGHNSQLLFMKNF